MVNYAIMRCKKLSGFGSVAASLQHAFRERETLNADPLRTPSNEHFGAKTTASGMGKLRELLPEKRRKDAVLCVEYVLTASTNWWLTATKSEQKSFFEKSRKWLDDKFGAQNVIVASVHLDETSPHITAYVIPLTSDGRLCAKHFIGNRGQMQADQTSFAAPMAELGLERGERGSKAKHTSNKTFNSRAVAAELLPAVTTQDPGAPTEKPGFFRPEERGVWERDAQLREKHVQELHALQHATQALVESHSLLKTENASLRSSEIDLKRSNVALRTQNKNMYGELHELQSIVSLFTQEQILDAKLKQKHWLAESEKEPQKEQKQSLDSPSQDWSR